MSGKSESRRDKSGGLSFYYPPAGTSASPTCLAPLCHVGLGTQTAAVIDQRSGRRVAFRTPTVRVVGPRGLACVECESEMFADGLHLAVLPDGRRVWVRDVRDTLAAADEEGDDVTDGGTAA